MRAGGWAAALLALSLLALALAPPATAQGSPDASLTVEVVTPDGDEPLDGLMLLLLNATTNATAATIPLSGYVTGPVDMNSGAYRLRLTYLTDPVPDASVTFGPPGRMGSDGVLTLGANDSADLTITLRAAYWYDRDADGLYDRFEPGEGESEGEEPMGADESADSSMLLICIPVGAVFLLVLVLAAVSYSKIRRERLLDHSTRQVIYGHIKMNPGAHLRGIKDQLGLPMGVLNHHLDKLESEELIRSHEEGQYRRFYPADMPASARSGPILTEPQRAVLDAIREGPGGTPQDVAGVTGQPIKNVYYHVDALERQGLIRSTRDGKTKRCYPVQDT